MSLLSKLSGTSTPKAIEPREIFMKLPHKDMGYARDVQTEVWKKWFVNRNKKDSIIKMNTGSGKTLVGLLILQSCLNEGKGPAIYVVPDRYLAKQVCEEAKKLGIMVTEDRDDYRYTNCTAILVTPVHRIINGRSVFGMNSSHNYPIGSVLLDDVHACIDTINDQFSIHIPADNALYKSIIKMFEQQWKSYNSNSYIDIVSNQDPLKSVVVPFWLWQEKYSDVYSLLSSSCSCDNNKTIFFNLPLISDCFRTCDCFITSKCIEIIPEGISISKVTGFENAQRRIFMSATLSDDSVFVSTLGLNKDDVSEIITPDNANDIGDRLILFPRHLNRDITNDAIKERIYEISQSYNVVVLVPSLVRARFWDSDGSRIVNKDNIDKEVENLKSGHVGLRVFVNRYDGIDLPNDACRMLVIDGLPPIRNQKERYIIGVDPVSKVLIREQIHRIEQGMGRGVRSNMDSCCIVLMGDTLSDVLLRTDGVSFFSSATQKQYSLSKELWDLLVQEKCKPSIDDIFELADYSLNQELEWIQKSKDVLSTIKYSSSPNFDEIVISLRCAYEEYEKQQYAKAADIINQTILKVEEKSTKGYLLQVKAKYENIYDKSRAQQTLLSGKGFNKSILSPIAGIQYDRLINKTEQAKGIWTNIKELKLDQNDFLLYVDSLTNELIFSQDSISFEDAFQRLGSLLGFCSTRPDKETNGAGPDNLWAIGNNKYLVVECKSAAVVDSISKDYCNQLDGSMRWFNEVYGDMYSATPIIIHPSNIIDRLATAISNMKVINQYKLESLKKSVKDFSTALVQDVNWENEKNTTELLQQYKLRGVDLVSTYSTTVNLYN